MPRTEAASTEKSSLAQEDSSSSVFPYEFLNQARFLEAPYYGEDDPDYSECLMDLTALAQQIAIAETQENDQKQKESPPDLVELCAHLLEHFYYHDLRMGCMPFCVNTESPRQSAQAYFDAALGGDDGSGAGSRNLGKQTPERLLQRLRRSGRAASGTEFAPPGSERPRGKLTVLTPEHLARLAPLFLWLANHEFFRCTTGRSMRFADRHKLSLPLDFSLFECNAEKPLDCCEQRHVASDGKKDLTLRMRASASPFQGTRTETLFYLQHVYFMMRQILPIRQVTYHIAPIHPDVESQVRALRLDFAEEDSWRAAIAQDYAQEGGAGLPLWAAKKDPSCWAAYASEDMPKDPVPPALSMRLLRFNPAILDQNTPDTQGRTLPRHTVPALDLSGLLEIASMDMLCCGFVSETLKNGLLTLEKALLGGQWEAGASRFSDLLDHLGFDSLSSSALFGWLLAGEQGPPPAKIAMTTRQVMSVRQLCRVYAVVSSGKQGLPHRRAALMESMRLRMPDISDEQALADIRAMQSRVKRSIAFHAERRQSARKPPAPVRPVAPPAAFVPAAVKPSDTKTGGAVPKKRT